MTNEASGCIILCRSTQRILLQLRSPDKKHNNYWGFWGGGAENGEYPIDTIKRELTEEIGFLPEFLKIHPLHTMTSDNNRFKYNTFVAIIENEFVPIINDESDGYAWVKHDTLPIPLHQGAKLVLQNPRIMSKINTIISHM